jgi:uncharacterized protein YaiI (UPF0178 family)
VIAKGALAVGHRGEVFDEANIADIMATWALHRSLREEGQEVGGPKAFGQRERAAFAATFDRQLQKLLKR